jgi:hypothetical protein
VHADAVEADHVTAAATVMAAQKRRALVVWLTDVAKIKYRYHSETITVKSN